LRGFYSFIRIPSERLKILLKPEHLLDEVYGIRASILDDGVERNCRKLCDCNPFQSEELVTFRPLNLGKGSLEINITNKNPSMANILLNWSISEEPEKSGLLR
jgi:hypothetical protein